jgi:Tol biopolymer transport system component
MPPLKASPVLASILVTVAVALNAQVFVYSGRQYVKVGRSWTQIWETDLKTGKRVQLTTTPRSHWLPWCAPDRTSILFASDSTRSGSTLLYRFDRTTKLERPLIRLRQPLAAVVDTIDDSRVIIQEYGGVIEIIDIREHRRLREITGVNVVMSPSHSLMAWQSPVDKVVHPNQRSHVWVSNVNGSGAIDLGEGEAPAFRPDGLEVLFVQFDKASTQLNVVRYNIASRDRDVTATVAPNLFEPYELTVSPDGSTMILAGCCGRYGSALYWRLTAEGRWSVVDSNLGSWGGWSPTGLLIYATDGRDLRPLDASRNVWVGDIKVFDRRSGQARTVLQGASLNEEPRWCGSRLPN